MKNLKKFNEQKDSSFDDNWTEEEEEEDYIEEEEEENDPNIYWKNLKNFFTFKK